MLRRSSDKISLTLEQHLKNFTMYENKTIRHDILWTTWCQNKRWLTHLLEYTLSSFPTYSLHDASHAESVIHNMELVLGPDRIDQLSATDTFMLLHVAYVHDIGMCITEEDKEKIIKEPKFSEMVNEALESIDPKIKNFANRLLSTAPNETALLSMTAEERMEACLEINQAVTHFLSEYRRKEHGEISKKRLEKMIADGEGLGRGFVTSEIPDRIFYQIASCAATHTIWGIEAVLDLKHESTGYANDTFHPRFIAVLLQVADALDIENGRFHSLVHSFCGKMNDLSEKHFKKHQAIRHLNISDKEIFISANCDDQEVVRLIRKECGWLSDLLKDASYHWSVIAPPGFIGCLPTLQPPELLLNGVKIPQELIEAKFNLSQDKAFRLVEGANVYSSRFPYIKEVVQNAIDASKLQMWKDYCGSMHLNDDAFSDGDDAITDILNTRMRKLLLKYPVEILLELAAIDIKNGKILYYNDFGDDFKNIKPEDLNDPLKYDFGVNVSIQDRGIGISSNDIKAISKVGVSHSHSYSKREEMPPILRTTGQFGIGLQSIFQITETFFADTKTRQGEAYHIEFHSGSGSSSGVINTTDLKNVDNTPYGTKVSFFISNSRFVDPLQGAVLQNCDNPFDPEYKARLSSKKAETVISQMIDYLDELFGETVFPVVVMVKDPDTKKEYKLKDRTKHSITLRNLSYDKDKLSKISSAMLLERMGWAFQIDKLRSARFHGKLDNGYVYYFDPDSTSLLIWSNKYHTFASISGERLYNIAYSGYVDKNISKDMIIYYKGISTGFLYHGGDQLCLVDYIDIKDADTAEIMMLNREGLTPQGAAFIDEIYDDLAIIAIDIFEKVAYNIKKGLSSVNTTVEDSMSNPVLEYLANEGFIDLAGIESGKLRKQVFKLSVLAYYAVLQLKNNFTCGETGLEVDHENCAWMLILKVLSDLCEANEITALKVSVNEFDRPLDDSYSNEIPLPGILYEIAKNGSFGIMSYRHEKRSPWMHRLIHNPISNNRASGGNSGEIEIERLLRQQQVALEKPSFAGHSTSTAQESYESTVKLWIFQNTPVSAVHIALDSHIGKNDSDGNVRFNTLTFDSVDEIHMNDEALYLLLKKLKKIYDRDGVKVFETTVFNGFKCLSLKEEAALSDTLFINKGCFGKTFAHKMLIPFSGDYISQLFKQHGENDQSLLSDFDGNDNYIKRQADFERIYTRCYNLLSNYSKEKFEEEELKPAYDSVKDKLEAEFSEKKFKEFADNLENDEEFKVAIQHFEESKKKKENATGDTDETLLDPPKHDREVILNRMIDLQFWRKGATKRLYMSSVFPTEDEIRSRIDAWEQLNTTPNLLKYTEHNASTHLSIHSSLGYYRSMMLKFFEAVKSVYEKDFDIRGTDSPKKDEEIAKQDSHN